LHQINIQRRAGAHPKKLWGETVVVMHAASGKGIIKKPPNKNINFITTFLE
jgi:hypothetical protein